MSERKTTVAALLIASMVIGCSPERNIGQAAQTARQPHAGMIDLFVPHISTERANQGSRVSLFVRERRGAPKGPVVLFVQGRSAAAVPPSISSTEITAGWFIWLMPASMSSLWIYKATGVRPSHGHGRPLQHLPDNQAKYLVPNPLPAPCPPRYPHSFGSFATDWEEIDTVVEFIRSLRGDRALKINLVGWSRGGMRVIGYAALRADNIEKVVALAPTRFPPVASVPSYPMNMTDRRDFFVDWDRQIDSKNCPQQVDPSIRQALWNSTIVLDKLGSGWGASGVRRSPAFTAAGWTPDLPRRVQAPTLVIRGALDDQALEQATRALYDALGGPKAYVTVSCGSHELVYEEQHTKLLRASAEWLRSGTYDGVRRGIFRSDRAPLGIHSFPSVLLQPRSNVLRTAASNARREIVRPAWRLPAEPQPQILRRFEEPLHVFEGSRSDVVRPRSAC
jgi:pimeloyl-ACP methyl ester carboxylesterase